MAAGLDVRALVLGIFAQRLHQRLHVHPLRGFAGALFMQIGEGGVEHADHVVEVLAHLALQLVVVDFLQPQLEPRQRRAQVVGHGAEHARALLDLFQDAPLHFVERVRRLPRFPWSRFIQWRAVEVFAQALGRVAQALDRPAQQFGAVPGGNDQCDQLKRQGHQRATEPRPWRPFLVVWVQWRAWPVQAFGKLRWRRRRWRAVMVKPGKGQQVREDNRQQQHAKQAAEQRIEAPAHQPMSRASNR
ncbi:hypothetical protein D3C86_1381860 [compost metagenome]